MGSSKFGYIVIIKQMIEQSLNIQNNLDGDTCKKKKIKFKKKEISYGLWKAQRFQKLEESEDLLR